MEVHVQLSEYVDMRKYINTEEERLKQAERTVHSDIIYN